MSSGYNYGDPEPRENCPYCGTECHADFCDVGVGMTQVGPYHCNNCGASQCGPYDDKEPDPKTGWFPPDSPAGSSANVDEQGRHISWKKADTLYRAKHGVGPRY